MKTLIGRPTVALTLSLLVLNAAGASGQRDRARAFLDSAIERMGGAAKLAAVKQARLEYITQWMRTSFETRPFGDAVGSYEINVDLRDYTAPAWRNTRRPIRAGNAAPLEIINVVRDTVASFRATTLATGWQPLSAAYLDERAEVFTFAPERVLPLAREAADLTMIADTTIGGASYRRVRATIGGIPATLLFTGSEPLLAASTYRAEQARDFGLAPWGPMLVEVWYSRWARSASGILFPANIDIARVGRPYKRIQVTAVDLAANIAADSFAIADSTRSAFMRTQNRAMQDLPVDSARIVDGRFVEFRTNGAANGAVRLGSAWWLLETGTSPMNAERADRWLRDHTDGGRVAGAIVTTASTNNGGVAWLAKNQLPVRAGAATATHVSPMLTNRGLSPKSVAVVRKRETIVIGADTAVLEPIDFPDAPGSLLVYVPRERWMYFSPGSPLQIEIAMRRAKSLGWRVEKLGTARGLSLPAPAQ
jgi:hypothetical protein